MSQKEPMTVDQKKSISLEVLKTIDAFCTEHHIQYSLAYGTLLGSVRHKGFIPWDDDVDIIMLREDYDRFIRLFLQSPPQHYQCISFENGTYYLPYTKIVDTRTHVVAENFIGLDDIGIYVDIFPFDYIANSREEAVKLKGKFKFISKLIRYTCYAKFKEVCNGKIKPDKALIYGLSKCIGFKRLSSIYQKRIAKLKDRSAKWVGYLGSCYESDENVFELATIKGLGTGEFEGCTFPVLENYGAFLSKIYGDYMSLPPVEKRVAHHETAYFKEEI